MANVSYVLMNKINRDRLQELEELFENEDMQELLDHENGYEGYDWDDLSEDKQEQLKEIWFERFVHEIDYYITITTR